MASCSLLSLGTRDDALRWKSETTGTLGYTCTRDVRDPHPAKSAIRDFFRASDEWLFIAGHFTSYLYNDAENIKIHFLSDRVRLEHDGTTEEIVKGTGFLQHQRVKAVFWGGCSTTANPGIVATLRQLFGPHLMIGWKAKTGWEVPHSLMGGYGTNPPGANPHFFTRVQPNPGDSVRVRNAWLKTGAETNWGSGSAIPDAFNVIDPGGRGWRILDGSVVPDPEYP